jgi:hypothetical protein
MTDKEIMQQALDALETVCRYALLEDESYPFVQGEDAITALRSRLEQPEDVPEINFGNIADEPVAWMVYIPSQQSQYVTDDIDDPQLVDDLTNTDAELTPLYTHPQPVIVTEWIGLTDDEIKGIIGAWGDTPIKGYTRKLFDQIETKLKEKNT